MTAVGNRWDVAPLADVRGSAASPTPAFIYSKHAAEGWGGGRIKGEQGGRGGEELLGLRL